MSREFNGGENPENKDLQNPSTLMAKEVVARMKAKENDLGLNDSQRSCKYATVYGKEGEQNPIWNIGDLEGWLNFYKELPDVYDKAGDENMEIVFFNDKDKIPVKE